jgi:hypothetical protein
MNKTVVNHPLVSFFITAFVFSWIAVTLILGVLWALWRLPGYLGAAGFPRSRMSSLPSSRCLSRVENYPTTRFERIAV